MLYDVVILGAGASGLMAASRITGGSVAIIDANKQIGSKILVSGGGQCNVTNAVLSSKNYDGDASFFDSVYHNLSNKELLALFHKRKLIPTKQDRLVKNQYFCQSSKEVTNYFQKCTKQAQLFLDEKILTVSYNDTFAIKTNKQTLHAQNVVVATGGISYPQLKATDIGYKIAEHFGHEISRLDPALVGFTLLPDQGWMKELSGLSVDIELTVDTHTIPGSMLCAHKGISGPAIMVASLYWRKGKISCNFLPKTTVEKCVSKGGKKALSTLLPLPKRFAKALLKSLDVRDLPISALSLQEKESLQKLSNYAFAPAGTFGYKRAEVTRGGVKTDTINPTTLESTLQKGLFFTGEVLDITGELGGYNLQWAFSSGFTCGEHLNSVIED